MLVDYHLSPQARAFAFLNEAWLKHSGDAESSGMPAGLEGAMADDDVFDYAMSDAFVSETRPVPYRTGFRSRKLQGDPSTKELLELSERDFDRYVRNCGRLPKDPLVDALDGLQAENEELRAAIRTLQQQMRQLMQPSSGMRLSVTQSESRGIDVKPRA